MVYSLEEIKSLVDSVARQFDIHEIRLFGSYFDSIPTSQSDIDLVVKYGNGCRGLDRIRFMNALEDKLNKTVDVLNVDFLPDFFKDIDLQSEERLIYAK